MTKYLRFSFVTVFFCYLELAFSSPQIELGLSPYHGIYQETKEEEECRSTSVEFDKSPIKINQTTATDDNCRTNPAVSIFDGSFVLHSLRLSLRNIQDAKSNISWGAGLGANVNLVGIRGVLMLLAPMTIGPELIAFYLFPNNAISLQKRMTLQLGIPMLDIHPKFFAAVASNVGVHFHLWSKQPNRFTIFIAYEAMYFMNFRKKTNSEGLFLAHGVTFGYSHAVGP